EGMVSAVAGLVVGAVKIFAAVACRLDHDHAVGNGNFNVVVPGLVPLDRDQPIRAVTVRIVVGAGILLVNNDHIARRHGVGAGGHTAAHIPHITVGGGEVEASAVGKALDAPTVVEAAKDAQNGGAVVVAVAVGADVIAGVGNLRQVAVVG